MSESILAKALRKHTPQGIVNSLPERLHALFLSQWEIRALPEQLEPGTPYASSDRIDWFIWLMLAGRGSGKTRAGAEWVRNFAYTHPGCRIALVARTAGDVRTTMLEGPSGLLSISPPWFMPVHNSSSAKVTWPNGSIALHFSAEEPKGLRGPQFHAAWCDELAAWPTLKNEDGEQGIPNAWTQLQYGIRMPSVRTKVIVTTTPRPTPVIKQLVKNPACVVTKWSTFDNKANLSADFIARAHAIEHSRMGRQEIHAEVLTDVPGALWTDSILDACHVETHPMLRRIVVAVDPSGGHGEENDEQGIVVAGLGMDGTVYVLRDATVKLSPDGWGKAAVNAYVQYSADRIVYEKNFGGEQVEFVIKTAARDMGVKVASKFVQASRGKVVRAEPVAALYEQGHVKHVGYFSDLEEQMRSFTPDGKFLDSPDRVDALVWAVTELALHDHVTLGDAPVVSGARRGSEVSVEDDEGEDQWQRR